MTTAAAARHFGLDIGVTRLVSSLPRTVSITAHAFPSLQPTRQVQMPVDFLSRPLRTDILHSAVTYERDNLRQGTASTKTRAEVSGSNRKLRKQKGSGSARLGDRASPMLRGGGRAHGPKPRDFGTDLPGKVYNAAVRIAVSHLYAQGSLICIDADIDLPTYKTAAAAAFLNEHSFARGKEPLGGRTLFVTAQVRDNFDKAVGNLGYLAEVCTVDDILVHELLKYKRVLIERQALDQLEIVTRI